MSAKVKILFPIDFSDTTEATFGTAQYLAKVYDAELFLLHVIEAPSAPVKIFYNFDEKEARKKANKMISDFVEKEAEKDVHVETIIKVGKPYRKIIEAANEISANAIVMGTHGAESMIKDVFTGTNASRVIKSSPCPVITIREKPDHFDFKKIVLPIDLTLETAEKIDLAVEFAQNFNSEIILMAVFWGNDESVKARLHKRLDMAADFIKKQNIPVQANLVVSKGENIAPAVVKFAHKIDGDLIMIMTQQEMNIKETVLGSSATWVVNHSTIPVMAITPTREYKSKNFSASHFG